MSALALEHFDAVLNAALSGTRDELQKLRSQAKRQLLFPVPMHMAQSEVIEYLRRQVFEDAVAAGWLKPCVRSKSSGKATVFYNFTDVQDVSLRIAAGEYPGAEHTTGRKAA